MYIGYNCLWDNCTVLKDMRQSLFHLLGKGLKLYRGSDIMLDERRLIKKQDDYASFTATFYEKNLSLGKQSLPLGLLSFEVLNMPEEQLTDLREATIKLKESAQQDVYLPLENIKDKKELRTDLSQFLPHFKNFLNELDKLPIFKYLEINQKQIVSAFVKAYKDDDIENNAQAIGDFLIDIMATHDELQIFRVYADTLLDDYIEKVKRRSPVHYAGAIHKFFNDKEMQKKLEAIMPPEILDNIFKIEQPINVDYITMKNPKNKKQYIVAERTIYRSIGGLLKADLFKALTIGNTPRRCHNCGEYFFIIGLSDTKYCSRIAPNDPKGRFCNKVGAHIKEQKKKEISYEAAYSRAYNRLKKRKYSKVNPLSDSEWNKLVGEIQDIRDLARAGKIPDYEAVRLLDEY